MRKQITLLLAVVLFAILAVQTAYADVIKTVGPSGGDYPTLKDAFDAINNGTLTGAITLQIINGGNPYGTTTATLNASGGSTNYTSLLIYPTSTGSYISCHNLNSGTPAIILNGADNVTIDGRVNQTGSTPSLYIRCTYRQAIIFKNGASNNEIKYCALSGGFDNASVGGVIDFDNTGGGNNDNTLEYNEMNCGAISVVLRSLGSAGNINSNNIIRNNKFKNGFSGSANEKNIIALVDFNTGWAIEGNSFYQENNIAPNGDGEHTVISIGKGGGTYAGSFIISGNYIGGTAPQCGGAALTKTNAKTNSFYGIYCNLPATSIVSIQGNTIKNISWSNASYEGGYGIFVYGGVDANIGTVTGNTIGESTGSGSITFTNGATNGAFTAINLNNTGTADIRNNVIGSIKTAGTGACNLIGISRYNTGATTIKDNYIGSADAGTANSMWAASTTTDQQDMRMIDAGGSGVVEISGNTISKITNDCRSTNKTDGTYAIFAHGDGNYSITGNVILKMATSSRRAGVGLAGIVPSATFTGTLTVSQNTIYNLAATYASYTGSVTGITCLNFGTGVSEISNNFVGGLHATGAGASGTITGLDIASGAATVSNNIISLGNSTGTEPNEIRGISDAGGTSARSYYFNTVSIYGNSGSATKNSYAFKCSPAGGSKDFRNNIFTNARSGLSGAFNYAYYISSVNGGLISDYNDYYVSGTGGVLGFYAAWLSTLADIRNATGGDLHSINTNPQFLNATGTLAADYKPNTSPLAGITGTGVTTDYAGLTRDATPTMGAFEVLVTTQAATSITTTAATGNGTIVVAGSYSNRGCIIYEYSDSDKTIGDPGVVNQAVSGSFGTGAFTANLTGLSIGSRYNSRAHATKSGVTFYGNRVAFYTLCNVPSAPTVENPKATSLDVTVYVNSNPAATEFCINETGSGQFVQDNGKLGAAAFWQTATAWGTKQVGGLTLGSTYTFRVKARNGDNVETAYGNTASGVTTIIPIVRTGVVMWEEGNHYDDATVWDVLALSGDGQSAFASSYYGTTYRYSNGTWTPSATNPAYPYFENLSMSNDGSVALAGGTYNVNLYSSGSWVAAPVPGANINTWPCIGVSGDGTKMLAGARNGRMYIYDGNAWTETRPAGDTNLYWTSADISDNGFIMIAAVGNGYPVAAGRVYLSNDGGTTWAETRPDGNANRVWKSVSVSRDGNVLFAVYQGSNNVFKSTDGGATWTSENPNPPYAADINWRKIDASYYGSEIAVSDQNGPVLYYSNGTWSNDFGPISCCAGDIAISADGDRMLVSNNSRTYLSFYGDAISDITFTSAIAHGTVAAIGGPAATQHGFVWSSTVTEPTVALTTKTEEGPITTGGTYQSQATGLTPNTLYYIRAYATNAKGTVYGDVVTFRTGTFRYVDLTKTSGANNGTSWADAYLELYSALDVAGEGDQIWVAKGTYKPKSGSTPRDSSFVIPKGIQVYGGFAGNETNFDDRDWVNNVTILSGDIGTSGTNTDNVYHVVKFTAANSVTILSGFTVTKGYANGGAALEEDYPGNSGGGIYNDGSGAGNKGNPIIVDCIISYNYANYQGGGVHNEANAGRTPETSGEASPVFINVTFTHNSSGNYGGAMQNAGHEGKSNPIITGCTFTNNSGAYGGAVHTIAYNDTCTPTFISCIFTSNSATDDGGAIRTRADWGYTNPVIMLCTFTNNHASADGGAIHNYSSSAGIANAIIDSCTFTGNTATANAGAMMNEVYNAGGISSPAITNCTFTNNSCSVVDGKGGAILNQGWPGTSSPEILNCSFTSNSADRGGAICNYGRDDSGDDGISNPTISNCSFKGNKASGTNGFGGAIFNYGRLDGESSPVYTNCLISGNVAKKGSAVYNNDGSPEFINCTMSGNYAITSGTFYSVYVTNSSNPMLSNCIIWHNNSVSMVNGTNGNPVVTYSDIEGSGGSSAWDASFGTDAGFNIDSDPVFASKIILTGNPTTAGDFRLTANSPCADTGQDSYISELFDIRGTGFGRFLLKTNHTQVGPVDMGAYEYYEGTDPLSPMPSLVTKPVTNITNAGGSTGGVSINDNGASITEKGIVWGTSVNPVLPGNKLVFSPADTAAFALTIITAPVSTIIHVRAFATNAGGTAYGEDQVFSTLANVPDAPTVANLNPGKLTVTVNPDGNPATTEYAILEVGGNFIQDDGSLGASELWKTKADWGTKAVIGLTAGTVYGFSVKARNGDLVETVYSDTTSGTPTDVPVMKWVTIDKIASWTAIRPSNHWYIAVSGDGSSVIAACGRINRSNDFGTTWTNLEPIGNKDGNWGLPAMSHSGDTILVGAYTQDGRLWRSYNKGLTWTEIRPAGANKNYKWYGLSVSENGMIMYSTRIAGGELNVTFRSTDAGVTWTALPTGMFGTNGSASGGVAFSADNSIQFMAGDRLYKSTDYGANWSLKYPLVGGGNYYYPNISGDGQVMAVFNGIGGKYWTSTDGGTNWSQLPTDGNGRSIAMSVDSKIMLALNYANPAYFSNDSATTWKSMNVSTANPTWENATMSNDGKVMYVSSYTYSSYGDNGCYRALMAAFDPITGTTATATANLSSLSGTSGATERGAIYYGYTDTDKQLGEPGVSIWSESGTFGAGTYTFTLTGLSPSTHYNARAYAVNEVGTGNSERTHFWTLPLTPLAPTVDNPAAHTLDVTIPIDSNGTSTEYAIYDTATAKYVQANGSLGNTAVWQTIATWGTKTVTGLATGAIYRFKVKARNGDKDETPFGPGTSDTTVARPLVTTQAATAISAIQATGNATIDSVFSLDVTNRGLIIYPYTNTNKIIGDADVTNLDTTGIFGIGTFSYTFTALTPNVRYSTRGHASNTNGTAYGARADFWTLANVPLPPFAGNATASSLDVAVHANGNSASTLYAIEDSSASSSYLKADGSHGATAVWQTAEAWDTLTVTGLATGVTYYFRVKAKNGNDTETAFSLATGANTCSNPTDGGTVGINQKICAYSVPDTIRNITLASNYGGAVEYQWQYTTAYTLTGFTDINGATNTSYKPGELTDTTWYRRLARVTCKPDWTTATPSNIVKITVDTITFSISGFVKYDNNPKTPLNWIKVILKKGSVLKDSMITGTNGYYKFNHLINGTYSLVLKSGHPSGNWQTWSGVNNTDDLLALRHATTGPLLSSNPPVIRISGDVKAPQTPPVITTVDADAIRMAAKYGWGNPPYFQIPKWVFSGVNLDLPLENISLNCGNATRDIRGLCAGDVNGTHLPLNGYKMAEPNLELVNSGTLPITKEITFPVRAERDLELGAITLMLDYDTTKIEITGVEMPDNGGEEPYFVVRRSSFVLEIGWMSLNPINVQEGQAVLMIHAKLKSTKYEVRSTKYGEPIRFTLNDDPLSELADGDGNVLYDARLSVADAGFKVQGSRLEGEAGVVVYPNPAKEVLNVEYFLEKQTPVQIELLNMQGIFILKLPQIRQIQIPGWGRERLDISGVLSGVYMLKVTIGDQVEVRKVIVNR